MYPLFPYSVQYLYDFFYKSGITLSQFLGSLIKLITYFVIGNENLPIKNKGMHLVHFDHSDV